MNGYCGRFRRDRSKFALVGALVTGCVLRKVCFCDKFVFFCGLDHGKGVSNSTRRVQCVGQSRGARL